MTAIRTVAAHEVVQAAYPRPVTEGQELGIAVGRAIDTALSRFSHEFHRGLRPTLGAMNELARATLEEELRDIDLQISPEERARVEGQMLGVLRAFRGTEVFGLPRPRSRLILIEDKVGVYAQPDYWDRKSRFFEMKSYRAVPFPADVALQLRLFQLGFPGLQGYLLCVNRHAQPPETTLTPIPPITAPEAAETLALALRVGLAQGLPKVLEYIDSPVVRYPASGAGAPPSP